MKYNVYAYTNRTVSGTEGYYSAIGWMGEKYVFLKGNISRMGEEYRIIANSIDADGIMEAWMSLTKDNSIIDNIILATRSKELYSYPENVERDNIPILITYLSKIYFARGQGVEIAQCFRLGLKRTPWNRLLSPHSIISDI